MGRTILVTGGSGLLGSYVIRQLAERGDQVINFDIREPAGELAWWLRPVADRIRFVAGGVDMWSEVVAVVREFAPEVIVHTAAIVDLPLLSKRPGLAMSVNFGGTFNVLEAARVFGVPRVVYVSSIALLPSIQYQPIDAKHPIFLADEGPGGSFYAAAKVAGEAFCWAYHQSFGLDHIILRPSAVYGFGMRYPIYIKPMVENSVRGLPTRFAQGREFPRDYTHVLDVTQMVLKAVDIPAEKVRDRVFYAATGRPLVTAGQVAEVVKKLIPGADIEIGSGLSENDLIEIRYRGMLSIENARQQLGYEPQFGDIEQGIAQYIETYRHYLAEMAR
ncbi:MAG: NAD-dependent epimerase/dehydratase family protein [Anaerolineae bacterium]